MAVENTRRLAGCLSRRVQVIGAHSADFVWRAGGAVAKAVAGGGDAEVIALSYGERGESGELWKQEGQTVENVKRVRHAEAEAAAGASRRVVPLPGPRRLPAADRRRRAAGDRRRDPRVRARRADHPHRHRPVQPRPPGRLRARSTARAAWPPAPASRARSRPIKPPQLFLFEPHQPELCNFTPTVHVDITSVWEQKVAAMAEMKAQQYLQTYYAQRGEQRGNHARRASGRPGRALRRVVPARPARRWWTSCERHRRARPARRGHRLRGRRAAEGLVDVELQPARARLARLRAGADRALRAGRQPDGPRRDGARCSPARCSCSTMPEPAPVALLGDLLATQAQVRGAAAVLVDAAVRDSEELAGDGPARSGRAGSARAARPRTSSASSTCRCVVGGAEIRPGDLVVLDADGVDRGRRRARRGGARGVARARGQGGRQAREAAGGRALLRARRAARRRRGRDERASPTSARSSCSRPRARRACAFFVDVMGMEIEAPGRAVDLPARLGRLPALVAEAHRLRHQRHGRARPARLEPGGARAPRRRGRGDRARRGLDRRRPRPRPVLPLPRPRRPPLRALLRVRALRAARSTCAPR